MKFLTIGTLLAAAAAAQPVAPVAPVPPVPPAAYGFGSSNGVSFSSSSSMGLALQAAKAGLGRSDWSDGRYRRGTRALDERRYEEAVESFDAVISNKESRTDGALYWKAYALNKLGKRTEALASLDALEREHAGSAWLNDAKALRLEVQQGSGQAVSPESQSDEDLKLLALNGLMRSDPERALPLIEKVLGDPKLAPKIKERALFVLAQNRTGKSREVIMNIAKGGGNPDLQVKAIEYLGISGGQAEVAQLYTTGASIQVKEAIINSLMMSKNVDKLVEIARAEKEPRVRTAAIERMGMIRSDKTAELLASLYSGDTVAKQAVINALFMQHGTKSLIDLARKEQDPKLKRELVERLSMMKDKEATDYMMEILK